MWRKKAVGICYQKYNFKMVCEGLAGNKRILLVIVLAWNKNSLDIHLAKNQFFHENIFQSGWHDEILPQRQYFQSTYLYFSVNQPLWTNGTLSNIYKVSFVGNLMVSGTFYLHFFKKLVDNVSFSFCHLYTMYRFLLSCHNKRPSYDFYFIIEEPSNY